MNCPACGTANSYRRQAPPTVTVWVTAPPDEPVWPELGRYERRPLGPATWSCAFCHDAH